MPPAFLTNTSWPFVEVMKIRENYVKLVHAFTEKDNRLTRIEIIGFFYYIETNKYLVNYQKGFRIDMNSIYCITVLNRILGKLSVLQAAPDLP